MDSAVLKLASLGSAMLKPRLPVCFLSASALFLSGGAPDTVPTLRPPQDQCPAVRDVDLRALQRRSAPRAQPSPTPAASRDELAVVRIPAWSEHRPSPTASVVIRARLPSGGGHLSDHRAVVWREADGAWWFWRQTLNDGPPAFPPPPAPYGSTPGSPEYEAWRAALPPAGMSQEDREYPPRSGRLAPQRAAGMERAWRDPCRAWDPDWWPGELPLKRRVDGSRRRICPPPMIHDWSARSLRAERRAGLARVASTHRRPTPSFPGRPMRQTRIPDDVAPCIRSPRLCRRDRHGRGAGFGGVARGSDSRDL